MVVVDGGVGQELVLDAQRVQHIAAHDGNLDRGGGEVDQVGVVLQTLELILLHGVLHVDGVLHVIGHVHQDLLGEGELLVTALEPDEVGDVAAAEHQAQVGGIGAGLHSHQLHLSADTGLQQLLVEQLDPVGIRLVFRRVVLDDHSEGDGIFHIAHGQGLVGVDVLAGAAGGVVSRTGGIALRQTTRHGEHQSQCKCRGQDALFHFFFLLFFIIPLLRPA